MADGQWVLITTAAAMGDQARAALAAIRTANGGTDPATLRDAYAVAPVEFALLIEALFALGVPVDQEMQQLAGLRPIGELLR